MKKLTRFAFFMTANCCGSSTNFFQSRWLADAILYAYALGDLTDEDIHFGKDHEVWILLKEHHDPFIKEKIYLLEHVEEICSLEDPKHANQIIKSKFRGINPWIDIQNGIFLLSELDSEIAKEFYALKQTHETGWAIKLSFPASSFQ